MVRLGLSSAHSSHACPSPRIVSHPRPAFVRDLPDLRLLWCLSLGALAGGYFLSQQLQGSSTNLLGGTVTMLQSIVENLLGYLLHPAPHLSQAVCSRILRGNMEVATQDTLQNRQAIFLHPGQIVGRSPPCRCIRRLQMLTEFAKKSYSRFLLFSFRKFFLYRLHERHPIIYRQAGVNC